MSVASCQSIFLCLMSCLIACMSRPGSDFGSRSEFRLVFDPQSDQAQPSPAQSGQRAPDAPCPTHARAPLPLIPLSHLIFLSCSNFPLPPLSPRGALGFRDEIAGVWIPGGEFSPPRPFLSLSSPPFFFPWTRPSPVLVVCAPWRVPPRRAPSPSAPCMLAVGRAPPRVAPPDESRLGRAPPRVAPPPASPAPAEPIPGRAPPRQRPSRAPHPQPRPLLRPCAPWPRPRLRPGRRPGGRAPVVPSAACPGRALGCALARPCPSPCPGSLAPRAACTVRVPPARAACSRACDHSRISFNPRLIHFNFV
jgi:hypothetical protein